MELTAWELMQEDHGTLQPSHLCACMVESPSCGLLPGHYRAAGHAHAIPKLDLMPRAV